MLSGSSDEQSVGHLSTLTDGLVSFDAAGNLFSAFPRFYCYTPASVDGCVDDPGVDVINKQLSSGTVKPIPVTGFTLSDVAGSPPPVEALGVDAQGVIVVQRVDGIAAYAPGGGTPDTLATGTFTSLVVG